MFALTPLRLSAPIMHCTAQGSLATEETFGLHPVQIELIKENKTLPYKSNPLLSAWRLMSGCSFGSDPGGRP